MIVSFGIIGAGLKVIDDAFDEGKFDIKVAYLLAPLLVILWIAESISNPFSATLLFSILFATLLTGKVDNKAFRLSSLSVILMLPWVKFKMGPLLLLTLAGVLDEVGDGMGEKLSGIYRLLLRHRPALKIAVLLLCMRGIFPWTSLAAILLFDASYDIAGCNFMARYYSRVQIAMISFSKSFYESRKSL
jgi:hypothetical protein